nr:uncharacterized protein LOC123494499 [Aegilops tauschii subsp. strangulata]
MQNAEGERGVDRDKNVPLTDMDIVNHEKEPINKIDVQIEIIANSRHNKPRRANTNITPQDYICTADDIFIIKSIMSLHEKTKLVHINDALLTNVEMRCLTHDDVFLHDDVINAYIYCISAQEHLQNRADGKVHIASTICVFPV